MLFAKSKDPIDVDKARMEFGSSFGIIRKISRGLIPFSEECEEREELGRNGSPPSALQLLGFSAAHCDWRVRFHNVLFIVADTYFTRTIAFPMLLKIRVSSFCTLFPKVYT